MNFEYRLAKQSQEVLGKVNTTVDELYCYELGIITDVIEVLRAKLSNDTLEHLEVIEQMHISTLRKLETMRLKVRSACNDKNN